MWKDVTAECEHTDFTYDEVYFEHEGKNIKSENYRVRKVQVKLPDGTGTDLAGAPFLSIGWAFIIERET